jgi:molecular chaperone Hsp33
VIFSGVSYHLLERRELSFRCTCSKEKVEKALVTLGNDELQKMIVQQEETEVTCEYCRAVYHFTREELGTLKGEMSS